MAAATAVYLFTPRIPVIVYTDDAAIAQRRFVMPYAKELLVNRGVDNRFQFTVLNQDEKPVNITNQEITFRLLSYTGSQQLLAKTLVNKFGYTGIAEVTVTATELELVDTQLCYYSLEIRPTGSVSPGVAAFTDAQGGARGTVRIVNSVLPRFVPSLMVTIPDSDNSETRYSSVIASQDWPYTTIQAKLSDYSGTIQIQGTAEDPISSTATRMWYDIGDIRNYSQASDSVWWFIEGYHPYVRLAYTPEVNTTGTIASVLAR